MANEIKYEKVTATNVTASGHVSASVFYGDGSGLSNVAGAGGGTVTEVTVGTGLDVTNGTSTPAISLDLTDTNTFTATATGDRAVVRDSTGAAAFDMVVVGSNGVQTNEAFLNIPEKLNLGNGVTGSAHHKITGSIDIKNNLTASGTVTATSFHGDGSNLTGLVTTVNGSAGAVTVTENVTTNLSTTATGNSLTINSSDGTNASIPAATTSAWGAMTDEDKTKLDGIETNADVTDATNVAAAGALMESEVTNLAQVKAFNSADYATATQGTKADSAVQNLGDLSITATATEINVLDGVTATTAELNYVDGVTSNIQTQLNLKAPLVSPALTGNPTAPTQTGTDDSTKIATTAFVQGRIDAIIGTAGATLDTLGELSASLSDDQDALTSLTTTVGTKLAKASNLSDLTNAATARTNLGVAIGTDVQAYNAILATVAGGTYTGDDSITTVGTIGTGTWQGSAINDGYISSATTWNNKLDKAGTIATNDYAKYDANGDLVGRSYSEVKSDLSLNNVENTALSTVSIIAGAGLTGGGNIASTKTINVIGGTGITVNADDVAIDTSVVPRLSANNLFTGNNKIFKDNGDDPILIFDEGDQGIPYTIGLDYGNEARFTISYGSDLSSPRFTLDDYNVSFGNTSATHQITGSLYAKSASFDGHVGIGITAHPGRALYVDGNTTTTDLTASGHVSASSFHGDGSSLTGIGTVTGTGVDKRIAVWDGISSITGSGLLYLNFNSTKLGINTSSPEKMLDVDGPVKLGNDSTHSSLLTGSFNLSGSLTIQKDTRGANSDYDITFKNTNGGNLGYIYTSGLSDFVFGSAANAWVSSVFGNTYIRSDLSDVDIGAPEVLISGSSGTYIFNQSYFGGTSTSNKVSTFTSAGKLGVKDTSPVYDLDVNGDVRLGQDNSNHKIFITGSIYHNATSGTGTQVLIKDSNNKIVTDVIDSRVFDPSSLVDGTGVSNYVAIWNDDNTITYDSGLYFDTSNNRLGLGTTSPVVHLDVRKLTRATSVNAYTAWVANIANTNTSANSGAPFNTTYYTQVLKLSIAKSGTSSGASADKFLGCYSNTSGNSNGTREYYIDGQGNTGTNFTSQHFTVYKIKNESYNKISDEIEPGMIIEAIGERGIDRNNETAVPVVSICSSRNSKKVFGVLSSDYEGIYDMAHWKYFNGVYNEDCRYEYEEEDGTITVVGEYSNESPYFKARSNSGGEGKIWITNLHGNIENGDFISSSEIAGFGALQEDDIMRSCTVAKCTEDIDWDSVVDTVEFEGQTYKKYLAFCTYHCG